MINNILVTNKVFLIAIRILNNIFHFMVDEREKESGVGTESRQEQVRLIHVVRMHSFFRYAHFEWSHLHNITPFTLPRKIKFTSVKIKIHNIFLNISDTRPFRILRHYSEQ